MSRIPEYNAEIAFCDELHNELRIIRIRPDDTTIGKDFIPGQYLEVGLVQNIEGTDKLIRRQYSLASAPGDQRGLELYIVLVADGALTNPLWKLSVGDRLWVNPKLKGKFTLAEVPKGHNYLFVATGTGLAPFVSMLRHYADNPPWTHVSIIHGVRLPQDLGYDEELHHYMNEREDLLYIPCVSRDPAFPGLQGRIPDRLDDGSLETHLGRSLNPERDQILICGNPSMIDVLVNSLQTRGFSLHKRKSPGSIHFERYW